MSLDVALYVVKETEIFGNNITHNLNDMADAAGIYDALWHPEKLWGDPVKASDLVERLEEGLAKLLADPDKFKSFEPANGWGDYEGLVRFVKDYIEACKENPDAIVRVSI